MNYTGERAIPWEKKTGPGVMIPHIMRYAWASMYAWDKSIVDLCCGSGYGSYLLSWVANHVTGIDISMPAIEYAQNKFSAGNLAYHMGDVTDPSQHVPADLYIAFECLEHLDDPSALIERINKPLIWSMPIELPSKFHKRKYSIDEICQLMNGSDFWYQSTEGIIESKPVDFVPAYVLGIRP